MLSKITETTKIRDWLKRINQIIDVVNAKTYSWDITSVKGQSMYTFSTSNGYIDIPANGEYVVYYSGIELDKRDYLINGDTLTFKLPPEEDGCPIRVRYLSGAVYEN